MAWIAWFALVGCRSPVVLETYLAIVNISPSGGAAEVALDTDVYVTFSEPLLPETVSPASAHLDLPDGEHVSAATSYDEDAWTVRVAPDDGLGAGTTYVLVLETDLSGAMSGPLPVQVRSSFTTEDDTGDAPPVAVAGDDQQATVGDLVVLDGTASSDPEGEPLSWWWSAVSVPEGALATLDDPTSATPSFIPDAEGPWAFGLVVNDGLQDSIPDEVIIEVAPAGGG